jgi:hypothetical protein
MKLFGLRSWSGHCGEEKNILPLPGIEPRFALYRCGTWSLTAGRTKIKIFWEQFAK